MTHTPWKLRIGADNIPDILTKDGKRCVATLENSLGTKEDAELIVKAVNAYEQNQKTIADLVETLKYVWERIYIDENAKYQIKEPFDLMVVIDAVNGVQA